MGTLKHERSLQTQWLLLCTCISFVRVEFHWSYYRSQQYKCGARKKVRVTEACWALTVRSKQLYFFERLAWSKASCYPMGKQSAPPGCCCMVRSKPRVSSLCIFTLWLFLSSRSSSEIHLWPIYARDILFPEVPFEICYLWAALVWQLGLEMLWGILGPSSHRGHVLQSRALCCQLCPLEMSSELSQRHPSHEEQILITTVLHCEVSLMTYLNKQTSKSTD